MAALVAYPLFFHGQPIRVRGTIRTSDHEVRLASGAADVLVAGAISGAGAVADAPVDVSGTFVDVGRFEPGDPRLRGVGVAAQWQQRTSRTWPGPGELLVVLADAVLPAESFPAPSVRALALDPLRYEEAHVTVVGRFRGRNLYADQPDGPGRSRWDFVLQSGEASVWVVGRRPRGDGFSLDVNARVDTGRWLEVSGTVRFDRGLVFLEGADLRAVAAPEAAAPSEPAAVVPVRGPSPEVLFSVPTADQTDVAPTSSVRIQFSRDLDPDSFAGQVRVGYVAAQSAERGEPQPPAVTFTTAYNAGQRVLEIRFDRALDRFRVVRVELGEGIRATDGTALAPWTLTFTTGG